MLARLHVRLPFFVNIPEGEEFPIYEYKESGYIIRIYPLLASEGPINNAISLQTCIDGRKAYTANLLQIDFRKDTFDRRQRMEYCDPPKDLMKKKVNSYIAKLRCITRSPNIHQVDFPLIDWELNYLNDDGTELLSDGISTKKRGVHRIEFDYCAFNRDTWNELIDPATQDGILPWDDLILDSEAELPSIGPSIVLAATALEVLISYVLDQLVTATDFPADLWNWINMRRQKEPSVEEQYDYLLKLLSGHSLREDPKLWEAFANLKTSRNSFVHEGIAKIGKKPITIDKARYLVASATEIILKVRSWMPPEVQWKISERKVCIESTFNIYPFDTPKPKSQERVNKG